MTHILLAREGAVATVTLDRPERLNAISTSLTEELHQVLFEVNDDPDIRVVVLNGNGRAFCAGDDLQEFGLQTASRAATVRHIENIQRITRDLMFSDKLVVGAVHGYAVGGGFEWLLNCDLVVAADDLVAFFPETEWGQFPTGGVTRLLPQTLGHQHAMELLVLGERQTAGALLDRRLVNWVVPRDQMMAKALSVARTAASRSPFSVSALKRLMTREISPGLERALSAEERVTIAAFGTGEARARSANFPVGKKT
ncbi:enoyl-CoA hydratase/isomerase family protein [uncultured Tistrella sp.]|jgi:enoyl-CoA hydratase/carnithine racemase|uniref:enoyl-CoA hydratase/isomerase family protein n=1 Tax=Tistrella mobilis TaxID=171437 RepID=UPI000C09A037|nr:enoyl-CoA hydratase/isomerase family protein [uncultured Tistrella sp.]MAM72420.1 enoyl-CoA hydratase [Tistrella sp.]